MGPILHVLRDPGRTAALREALTRLGWTNHVATLRGYRKFDPRLWLHLRRQVRDVRPTIIHAWGVTALRAVIALECGDLSPLSRVVQSGYKSPHSKLVASEAGQLGWLERWLVRCTGVVLAAIPPAIVQPPAVDREESLRELGIPPDARIIAYSGEIEHGHGFMEAAWVFDILKYVYPKLWLLVLGDGSRRRRVEEFARCLAREDFRVCFAGARPDAPALLSLAEVVWVLGDRGGMQPTVEALAAGRPVVARQRADLAELLGEAETGFLVPKADRHEVARATRRILDDDAMRLQFELATRIRAQEFAPDVVAAKWAELYAQSRVY